jgi:hypothetical protein
MPALHVGYIYEGWQGLCWKLTLKHQNGFAYRHSGHFDVESKYRIFLDHFSIAPLIGIKSEAFTLDRGSDWLAHHLHGFLGIEVLNRLPNQRTLGLEIKLKRCLQHNLVVNKTNSVFSQKLRRFNGFEIEVPYRMNLLDYTNKQVEIRPIYHYSDRHHKIGLQAHLIHWF